MQAKMSKEMEAELVSWYEYDIDDPSELYLALELMEMYEEGVCLI